MGIGQLKSSALASLKGNWGTPIAICLVYDLLLCASAFTLVGPLLLTGPISVGLAAYFINNHRNRNGKFENLFSGFNNFGTNFVASLLTGLYTFFWSLLFIIPGIVKTLSYSMTFYILNDAPNMSASDAITESRRIMNGNKAKLFCLNLSFIGWAILSILTLGIGLLWLIPYMQATTTAFYQDIATEKSYNRQNMQNMQSQYQR